MTINFIWPMTDEPVIPDINWLNAEVPKRSFACGHDSLSDARTPIPVQDTGENVAYSFVSRIGVDAIRSDLRELLSPEIEQHCDFQSLLDSSGALIPSISAIIPRHRCWLRAGKKSTCHRCKTCGLIVYNPSGRWYLLHGDAPKVPIFTTHYGGLALSPELFSRVSSKKWRKLKLLELPIYETPNDSYPADLNEVAT